MERTDVFNPLSAAPQSLADSTAAGRRVRLLEVGACAQPGGLDGCELCLVRLVYNLHLIRAEKQAARDAKKKG